MSQAHPTSVTKLDPTAFRPPDNKIRDVTSTLKMPLGDNGCSYFL